MLGQLPGGINPAAVGTQNFMGAPGSTGAAGVPGAAGFLGFDMNMAAFNPYLF